MKKIVKLFATTLALMLVSGCAQNSPSDNATYYSINWANYDGSIIETDRVKENEIPLFDGEEPFRPRDSFYNYSFSGWNPEIVPATKDQTYIAQFDRHAKDYVITWKNYNGQTLLTEGYDSGETPSYSGETPSRAGNARVSYAFNGWEPAIKPVDSNAIYYAKYDETINKYTVTWKNYDDSVLSTETYEYGSQPTFKGDIPIKPIEDVAHHYEFKGWSPNISTVTSDATYTAQFSLKINTYTIKWQNYDGTTLSVETYNYGSTPSYKGEEPKKSGDNVLYVFDGWDSELEIVKTDKIYTAVFAIGHEITWQNYDGTLLLKDIVKEGDIPSYSGKQPTKPNDDSNIYIFDSWSPEVTPSLQDTTYTAVFEVKAIFEFEAGTTSYFIKKCNFTDATVVAIPETYRGFDVTRIKSNAFSDCKKLETVILTNRITSIESSAFSGSSLKYISVPDSVKAFYLGSFAGCASLESIDLPFVGKNTNPTPVTDRHLGFIFGNVKTSGFYQAEGFYIPKSLKNITVRGGEHIILKGCSSLENVIIPNTIEYIDEYSFSGCSSLKSIEIPNSVVSIESYAFQFCSSLESVNLLDGTLKYIFKDAFYKCKSLKSINIPDSTNPYGVAFNGCSSLESISVPYFDTTTLVNHTEIAHFGYIFGKNTYDSSYNAQGFYLPKSLKRIDVRGGSSIVSFKDCKYVEEITLASSIQSISNSIYDNCDNLLSINIEEGSDNYKSVDGVLYNGDMTSLIKCPQGRTKELVIPDTVTTISADAFINCKLIPNIVIPKSVQNIAEGTFEGCSSLVSMTIPFVGGSASSTVHFGYIFGKEKYTDSTLVKTYYIPTSLKTVIVTGGNNMNFVDCKLLETIIIPDTIQKIGGNSFANCSSITTIDIPDSVTAINSLAFSNCKKLETVTIGSQCKSIAYDSFANCPLLTKLTFSSNNHHLKCMDGVVYDYSLTELKFCVDKSINTVTVPVTVTSICDHAFYECSSLKTLNLSGSLASIGSYAFYGCSSLESLYLPDSLSSLESYAFYGCSSLKNISSLGTIISISEYTFYGCSSLESIVIPNGVTGIGNRAFYGCSSLVSISMPNTIKFVSYYAFAGCSLITSITLPNEATIIYSGTFSGCSSLESIDIPESVTTIDPDVFNSCSSIKSIRVPNSVTKIGDRAFLGCSSLESLCLPDSLSSLGYSAFYGCSSLKSINIPNKLAKIDNYVFKGCSSLKTIEIPENITSFGLSTFENCSSLESFVINETVTFIGDNSFLGCSSLSYIELRSKNLRVGSDKFGLKNVDVLLLHNGASFNKTWFTPARVYYVGTAEEWISANYGISLDAAYFYTETAPTQEGNYWHYVDGVPTVW